MRALVLALAVTSTTTAAPAAWACGCGGNFDPKGELVLHADEPIFIGGIEPYWELLLFDITDETAPAELTGALRSFEEGRSGFGRRWNYFVPTEPLTVGSRYEVRFYDNPIATLRDELGTTSALRDAGGTLARLTATAAAPRPVPAAPVVQVRRLTREIAEPQTSCDNGPVRMGASFSVAAGDSFFFVALRDSLGVETTFPSSVFSQAFDAVFTDSSISFANFDCSVRWPLDENGGTAAFRFATVNEAGTLSVWSEPAVVTLAPLDLDAGDEGEEAGDVVESHGCASTSAASAAALLLLLRRRRAALRAHRSVDDGARLQRGRGQAPALRPERGVGEVL